MPLLTAKGFDVERMDAKGVSVVMAYAAFRYCLGGSDKRFTIREVITWLELLEKQE